MAIIYSGARLKACLHSYNDAFLKSSHFSKSLIPECEIQSESAPIASTPPPDWSRSAKDYFKIVLIIVTILTFVLNVGPFKRFKGKFFVRFVSSVLDAS